MTENKLPQRHEVFLTDGGIETMLIFDDGQDLPNFAAFHLLQTQDGQAALHQYFERFISVATAARTGFILESPTWRANPDWGDTLGYSSSDLASANRAAIGMMHALRNRYQTSSSRMLVSGCVGPRGDGYVPSALMSPHEAADYHDAQIATFADAGIDLVTAITMTNAAEATGVARSAARCGIPCVISFTVETDGRLPSGQTLQEAIQDVDGASGTAPAYYMINCAHPTHFDEALVTGLPWLNRIGGLRANASRKSHAELNESTELDRGDPDDLGRHYRALRARLPGLRVMGGCCGTDHRHVAAIAAAVLA